MTPSQNQKQKNLAENPQAKAENSEIEKLKLSINTQTPAEVANLSKAEATRKKEVKKEKTGERSDVGREVIERNVTGPDTETPRLIASLDLKKSSESSPEQKEGFQRLELVTFSLLAKLFDQGVNKNIVLKLKNITYVGNDQINKLNPTEKITIQKLKEAVASESTPLAQEIFSKWNLWVETAHKNYVVADKTRNKILGHPPAGTSQAGTPAAKPSPSGESQNLPGETKQPSANGQDSESWIDGKINWMKENPGKAALYGVAAAAGIYTLYSLFSSDDKKEGEAGKDSGSKSSSSSFLEKFGLDSMTGKLKAGGIFMLILGSIIGMDKIKDFVMKIYNVGGEIADKIVTHIKDGNYAAAAKAPFEGSDKQWEYHKKLAEILTKETGTPISVDTIKDISNAKYEDFVSLRSKAGTYAQEKLGKIPWGIGEAAQLIGKNPKKIAEEKALREYLKKNENKIKAGKDATIFEVLTSLTHMSTPEPVNAGQAETESAEAANTGNAGSTEIGLEMATIREKLKNKPHIQEVLNKYEKNWTEAVINSHPFWSDLFDACHQDNVGIILADNKVVLKNGNENIPITKNPVLYQSAKEVIEAAVTDKTGWSDYVENIFIDGIGKCVLVGAGLYGIKGLVMKRSLISAAIGTVEGGFKGLFFPFVQGPRIGQRIGRSVQGLKFDAQIGLAPDELTKIKILENRTQFYAEIAQKYENLLTRKNTPGRYWDVKKWYAKLGAKRIEKLKEEYTGRFAESFNELQKVQKSPKVLKVNTAEQMHETGKEMEAFLEERGVKKESTITPLSPIDIKKGEIFKKADGTLKTAAELETEVTNLKEEIKKIAENNPLKKAKIRELIAIETYLDPQKAIREFKMHSEDISKMSDPEKVMALETKARQLEAIEKGTQAKFNEEAAKIAAEAKANKLPLNDALVTAKLDKLDGELLIPFAQKKQEAVETILKEYKLIPKNLKTPALIAQIKHTIEGVEGTRMTRLIKAGKGRAKMMTLMASAMFMTDQVIHRNDPERELHTMLEEIGPDLGQLLLDCLPIAGTGSNFYSACTGKELVGKERDQKTGLMVAKDVSGAWDRTSNVIWGTVGLAGDVITIIGAVPTGGTAIGLNIFLRLSKQAKGGSKAAAKLIKMWPRIQKIADRMGGFYNFTKKAAHYLKLDSKVVVKGLRKIEKIGTVAGTGMLVGGAAYHLHYAFVDEKTEMEIPPELGEAETTNGGPETAPATPNPTSTSVSMPAPAAASTL